MYAIRSYYAESGGTPDLIGSSGAAVLVPPADVPALTAAIERVMDDPDFAASLGAAGRAYVAEHFSHELQCERIEQLIERIRR